MKVKKILVPVDFSENSHAAFAPAAELAERFDASIVLLHVVEPPVYLGTPFGAGIGGLPALHDDIKDSAQKHIERLREKELPNAKAILRDGVPFLEIIGAAEDEGADLIVIATHGHTGIKHVLMGSTAEKVVRQAGCPVLTVRGTES